MNLNQDLQHREEEQDRLTKIIKQYGPAEFGYACLWAAEDIKIIREYVSREAALLKVEDQSMHIEFMNQIERALNDHKGAGISVGSGKKAEIQAVSKAADLPTIQGLSFCSRLVIGTASKYRYMGAGGDSRESRAYHQQLLGELGTRADMDSAPQGSITRVAITGGDAIKFIGIFPSAFPTITVKEAAVFNILSGTTGTMLDRLSFPNLPIAHTAGGSAFTISILINFLIVTRWG